MFFVSPGCEVRAPYSYQTLGKAENVWKERLKVRLNFTVSTDALKKIDANEYAQKTYQTEWSEI